MEYNLTNNKYKMQRPTMQSFLINPITGDLNELPGMRPELIQVLQRYGITSTQQLIAKYLSFNTQTRVNEFYMWCVDIIDQGDQDYDQDEFVYIPLYYRCIIEKMNILQVAMYDPELFHTIHGLNSNCTIFHKSLFDDDDDFNASAEDEEEET